MFILFYGVYIFTKDHRKFRTIYVLLFSLFFYYKAGGEYVLLLLASLMFNFILSELMDITRIQWKRKALLVILISANLLLLGYYKYTNFFIDNVNSIFSQHFSLKDIVLPVGISFFTFQAISYIIDLYKKQIKPARDLQDFAFYLCFFPQLVAGPIVRAKDFLPQMEKRLKLSNRDSGIAIFMIMIGLIKKTVISDYISLNFVDRVFDSPMLYSSFENLMATYGYTLQIYCDFSGYSDIAIGLALLMGFKLPENFRTPYKSTSITEFWRRWHISLSSWLRDYLYIPLGGNRKGRIRMYVNLMITMLLGGLWHGASWKFVMWGGLHGAMLVIEKFFKKKVKLPGGFISKTVSLLLTFHFVAFCWIFFRAENFSVAMEVVNNITDLTFHFSEWLVIIEAYKNVFILFAIGYVMHFLPDRFVSVVKDKYIALPFVAKAIILGLVFWLVYATSASGPQPFIYFQF
ncbi:MBOAT family protein [Dysgonomonas sp. 520]|nr:MBOAT family protein [Dysgonomonas sp. 520]